MSLPTSTEAENSIKATTPSVVISYDRAINYAFQQNAIPVIKELRFQNDASPRKDMVIWVSTEPAFASPVEIRLQSIAAKGEYRVTPLELKLSHDFLFALNEKLAGWLKVEVVAGETVICTRTEPICRLRSASSSRLFRLSHRPGRRGSLGPRPLPARGGMRRRYLPSGRNRPRPGQAASNDPGGARLEAAPDLVHRLVA